MTKISDVKISIIVPVYSAEKYLESCVKSITEQTHENLEIILVNDGSPDSSGKICDELARGDGRITVIHKERGGVSSARNRGLDVADGEWIGFVDSDDRIEPDMYAYLLAKAAEYGADLVQCATFFDEDSATAILNSPKNDIAVSGKDELSLEFFKYLSGGTCSKLFKRERIEGVRYDESLTIGEDMRFNLDAIFASRLTVLATEPKYHYVQRPGSACHSELTRERLTSYSRMICKAEADFSHSEATMEFLKTEKLRNAMDIASKTAQSGYDEFFDKARQDLKEVIKSGKKTFFITKKDRIKAALIIHAPLLYKFIIKAIK